MLNECGCGCGELVSNNYVIGHNQRGATNTSESNAKRSATLKGRPGTFINRSHSAATKEKLSRIFSGPGNPMHGQRRTHTVETIEKIRQAHIGKTLTPEQCNKISLSKSGKKRQSFSTEWKKKMSASKKGRPSNHKGYKLTPEQKLNCARPLDQNGCWKGGISFEEYPMEFNNKTKERIKSRDGYRCQNPFCWGKDSVLHIHHIDYNKRNCCFENLITVCRSCNSRANKDRDKWKQIYQETIMKIAA